uniref:Phosphotransferase n=1 Tax=Trichuris muris TaxID=70415 RepID=A0A5S6QLY4_TRIMR
MDGLPAQRRERPQTRDPAKIVDEAIKASAVVEHVSTYSLDLQPRILCNEKHFHLRQFKEAFYIRHNRCINRDKGVQRFCRQDFILLRLVDRLRMVSEGKKLRNFEKALPNPGLDESFIDNRWPRVYKLVKDLDLTLDDLKEVMNVMSKEMDRGLSAEPGVKSCLKMLPSYVRHLPDGTEVGPYLAMDLGGTNFRILLINLRGQHPDMINRTFRIPSAIMIGHGNDLFRHIAKCLHEFLVDNNLMNEKIPLGFTFSFPCEQHELADATLITWTKGFNCKGVVGKNVVQLLQNAIDEYKDIKVKVVALLNDTVGTQMALAYSDHNCHVGLIVGTGSNACYTEKMARIPKLKDASSSEMIINMEWAGLGEDGCLNKIMTSYDKLVDRDTINPGKQLFEKVISGMYMGEIVRFILLDLVNHKLLFNGKGSTELSTPGKFSTKHVSEIELDLQEGQCNFSNTYGILEDLGIEEISVTDCAVVSHICALVSSRAAYLCGAGVACLLNRIQKPLVTVGVDGSVYRYHPNFGSRLKFAINLLKDPALKFELKLSQDGSGLGAALVAAVAWRVSQQNG